MSLQQLAGSLLVLSFLFLVAGAMVAPGAAYTGADMSARLDAIARSRQRWVISKVFDGVAMLTPAMAMLILTVDLIGSQPGFPLLLATIGFMTSGSVGVVLAYRLVADPEHAFTTYLPRAIDVPGSLGLAVGMLSAGWVYLQGAYAPWIGYLSTLAGAMTLAAYLFSRFAITFDVVALLGIVNTIVGIALITTVG